MSQNSRHGSLIRPATDADFPAVLPLLRQSMAAVLDISFAAAIVEARLCDRRYRYSLRSCLVAEADGGLVGCVMGYPAGPTPADPPDPHMRDDAEGLQACFRRMRRPDSWYVASVSVDPARRRRGLGRVLVETQYDKARDAGADGLSLHVFDNNVGAIAFYETLGFRVVDRCRPPAYAELPNDPELLLMAKPSSAVE